MINNEVVEFIKKARLQGAKDVEIRASLKGAGWDSQTINDAFFSIPAAAPTQKPAGTQNPTSAAGGSHMVLPDQPSTANPGMVAATDPTVIDPLAVQTAIGGSKMKKRVMLGVLLGLGVIVLALGGVAYAAVGLGKPIFGFNIQDEVWIAFIENSRSELAERDIKVTYADTGTFEFLPSKAAEAFGYPLPEEEKAEMDKRFGFTLQDPGFSYGLKGYADTRDYNQPKVDVTLEASATNRGITYASSLGMKYKEPSAYFKIGYNESVTDLLNRTLGEEAKYLYLFKDKWYKVKTADTQDMELGELYSLFDLSSARGKSRDAKRLADVRQLASGLELYYNNCQAYPAGSGIVLDSKLGLYSGQISSGGCTGGGFVSNSSNQQSTTYLAQAPVSPTPADGTCSEDMNSYRYTIKPNGQGYILTFCLGGDTGGYTSGNQQLTETGTSELIDCPSGLQCKLDKPREEEEDPFTKILKENRLIDIESFKGFATVEGKLTLHYKVSFNETKFKEVVFKLLKELVGEEEYNEDKESQEYAEKLFDWFLEKLEITNMEVWVGVTDHKVYKTATTSNMLSLVGTANLIRTELEKGNIQKLYSNMSYGFEGDYGDAKRMADIRQLASALELYYNDFLGYPEAKDGKPVGLEAQGYYTEIPAAPLPPGGKCTDFYNNYWYAPVGTPETVPHTFNSGQSVKVYKDYKYSFCLGSAVGGYEAGNYYLTPTGIKPLDDCPSSRKCYEDVSRNGPDNPASPEQQAKDYVMDLLKKLPFTAQVTAETQSWNFDKEKEVEEPKESLDLQEEIGKMYEQQYPVDAS